MRTDKPSSEHDNEVEISDLDTPSQRTQQFKRYAGFLVRSRRRLIPATIVLASLALIALLIYPILSALPYHSLNNTTRLSNSDNTLMPALLGSTNNIICVSGKTPGTFYGLHSDTGTLAWRYQRGQTPLATPIMARNLLYLLVPSDDSQNNSMLMIAVSADKGTVLWQSRIQTSAPSSLAVVGNVLYITAQDGTLIALDARSGNYLWIKHFPPNPFIQVLNDVVYVYVNDMAPLTSLWAIQAERGTLLWEVHQTTFSRIITNSAGITLLQTEDHGLEGLRTSDGHVLWPQPVYADVGTPIITTSTTVYLNTTDGELTAVNLPTGKVLWRVPQQHYIQGQLLISHDLLYLASIDDTIYTFHIGDGSPAWQADLYQLINGDMSIIDSRLYVHTNNGFEYALNATTGVPTWTSFIGQPASYQHITTANTYAQTVLTTPSTIYITQQNNMLFALRSTDGHVLWTRQLTTPPQPLNNNLYAIIPDGSVVLLNTVNGRNHWSYNMNV
jgi:outer membrane protein assembly factor BamB